MKFKEGIIGVNPVIDKIRFEQKNRMDVYLEDGRVISVPLSFFPSIQKLSVTQRRQYHISDGQILLFKDCDEVFHLEQFLGSEPDYRYSFIR